MRRDADAAPSAAAAAAGGGGGGGGGGSEERGRALAADMEGVVFASGSEDGAVRLWRIEAQGCRLLRTLEGHAGPVRALAMLDVSHAPIR